MRKTGNYSNIHQFVDLFINNIKPNSICVDGTLGNGLDTVKISKKLNKKGKIYAFDIQNEAIVQSKKLFKNELIYKDNIILINDSHVNVDRYIVEEVDFFILNLGYLPGGNKKITTNSGDVIEFIKKISQRLSVEGLGLIVFYPGHVSGYEELKEISKFLSKLDQKLFNVISIKHTNQVNNPPQMSILERI